MDTPVTWLFQIQKFEDGLAVHIGRGVKPSDVQDRRGQVNVENDLWDSAKGQVVTPGINVCVGGMEGHFLHTDTSRPSTLFPYLSLSHIKLFHLDQTILKVFPMT